MFEKRSPTYAMPVQRWNSRAISSEISFESAYDELGSGRCSSSYAPLDEEHRPLPNSSYALSKLISEEMAREFHRWTGIAYVGLRFSNILEPDDYEDSPKI